MRFVVAMVVGGIGFFAAGADEMADYVDRLDMICQSRLAYQNPDDPCACPYDGRSCGGNSAYLRDTGAQPLCYPSDVSDEMLSGWRSNRSVPDNPRSREMRIMTNAVYADSFSSADLLGVCAAN